MSEREEGRSRREFLAEAEELLEGLGRDLERLEGEVRHGPAPAERVNAVFRGVHSLKGICGLVGRAELTGLVHQLEDYLDRLRMGEALLDTAALDLLFDALEGLERLVLGRGPEGDTLRELRLRILRATETERPPEQAASTPGMPLLPGSLTRYEEHRLRENLKSGRRVLFIDVQLPFDRFDSDLRALIDRLSPAGELISTLPSYQEGEAEETLSFRLLLATTEDEQQTRKRAAMPIRVEAAPPAPGGEQPIATPVGAPPPASTAAPLDSGAAPWDTADLGPPDEEDEHGWPLGVPASVRVDLERLDRVMTAVGELLICRRSINQVARQLADQASLAPLARDLAQSAKDLEKRLNDLQRSVIEARMVPVGQVVGRLSRLVRKLARQSGKQVRLVAEGERTELDKMMMDRVLSPLMHLIRNAVDHGIEPAAERQALGKPDRGTLTLSAAQKGNSVVLTLADDGRGLQVEAIRQSAIRRGLLPAKHDLTLEAACELIFRPGFSSSTAVDEISGRGVGLDVVRREVAALNGSLRVRTTVGEGTSFEIELPITLAIIESMLVRTADSVFAIPVASITETLRLSPDRVDHVARQPVVRLRGETLPLVDLRDFFRIGGTEGGIPAYVVVARVGERSLALGVDAVIGQHEVVIKPIGRRLERIPGLAGATELGENEAALVVDVSSLAGDLQALGAA